MDLSVIIVNYNVKYFLEQCLCSVQQAIQGIEAEVLVVDNASADDSIAYLQPKFPVVQFIQSNQNIGFAKANNLALQQAKGRYILFLNPDTIVAEDSFTQCMAFMQAHNNCGALGVRMMDGSGSFLPESKRSFPLPWVSFFKLTGLAQLFPHSAVFNRYALGHLAEKQTHEVDVICGAFMMLTKQAAQLTKGFDEDYFMYGEDVDLSYRLQQLGYRNYYFAGTSIIHFKGESAGQNSKRHNQLFYKAMMIFVQKHYAPNRWSVFAAVLQVAIMLRSGFGFIGKLLQTFTASTATPKATHFYLYGDEAAITTAKTLLQHAATETLTNNQSPISHKHIIICAAQHYTSLIQQVEQWGKKNHIWVHGYNSKSMVSSTNKNGLGGVMK